MVRPTLTAGRLPELTRHLEKATLHRVAKAFGVPVSRLVGKPRDAVTAEARQVAMWLLREISSASFADIATALRRVDHQTSRHAYAVISKRRLADPEFARKVDELRDRLAAITHKQPHGE